MRCYVAIDALCCLMSSPRRVQKSGKESLMRSIMKGFVLVFRIMKFAEQATDIDDRASIKVWNFDSGYELSRAVAFQRP